MVPLGQLRSNLLVKLGEVTGRTHALPMVLFAPTSRCNSRCVSCEWWRADGKDDLTLDEIRALAAELPRWGTRVVVLTGGEPLLRPDVMQVADAFRSHGLRLHLLTSGLALARYAGEIAPRFEAVIVSLDGHTASLYRRIRGVDGLEAVAAGVRELRARAPQITVRGRSTIHRHNFRFLPELVAKARELGLDQISFLAADVTSDAFNRQASRAGAASGDAQPPPAELLLEPDEVAVFAEAVDALIRDHAADFAAGRIAPPPEALRRLPQYYRAQLGQGPFPPVECNAPWMSVLIEANGAVRPCFFHPAVGNLRERSLGDLLGGAMPRFRRALRVADDPTCRRCVCTLKTRLGSRI